jgi:hypothetical protein
LQVFFAHAKNSNIYPAQPSFAKGGNKAETKKGSFQMKDP